MTRPARSRIPALLLTAPLLAAWAALAACAPPAGDAAVRGGVVHLDERLADARYVNVDLPDVSPTVDSVARRGEFRRTLRVPSPGRLEFRLELPEDARLDVGLATERGSGSAVTFRVRVGEGDGEVLLEETVHPREAWRQRRVDLSGRAGRPVDLVLEADSESPGAEALWATPVISGSASTPRPNVILYIIDAAGAEYMSLYGYNRRTTPNLERLAEQGVVFERAYSNSSWTKLSTPSFLSSLHSSALGGYRESHDKLPAGAVPVAEVLHRSGYQTALLTSNPFAGTMTGLERGVDVLRQDPADPVSRSSPELHAAFHDWRSAYPGTPYYVHFQTTDVHWPWTPPQPFAGLYTSADLRERFYRWEEELAAASGMARPQWLHGWRYSPEAFAATGIDKALFFDAARGLYDEAMAHNDHQLGRLVDSLKAEGEWENTLLIIASDHGSAHGLGLFDPVPARSGPLFNPYRTHIPLLVVWPDRIPGGRRVSTPVSMIDVLPTILDAAGLAQPEIRQGQSLLPLMTGRGEWTDRPVVLDEFYVDPETGVETGWIEVVDGRWGASLYIEPANVEEPARTTPLLLYDLLDDPYTLHSQHEEYPDLAAHYRERLESLLVAHRALAQTVGPAGRSELSEEQIEALRSLGYIE